MMKAGNRARPAMALMIRDAQFVLRGWKSRIRESGFWWGPVDSDTAATTERWIKDVVYFTEESSWLSLSHPVFSVRFVEAEARRSSLDLKRSWKKLN